MNKKISIILSTYNEAYIIDDTIKKILTNIENVEIVIVDDNSSDGTCDIIDKINNPKIRLFRRSGRGLSSAFLLGLINSTGEIVGWFDSNMPELIDKVPVMLESLETNDLVILSRFIKGGEDTRSKLRVLSSKIINIICRLILGNKVNDYTSGVFLMNRKTLNISTPICYGHGEFFIEYLHSLNKRGAKIDEISYIHPEDVEGMSKTATNLVRFLRLGTNYITRIFLSLLNRR